MPIERRALVKAVAILCITGGLAALTSAASAGPPTTPSPYGCPWGVLSGYNVVDVCQQTVDNSTAAADPTIATAGGDGDMAFNLGYACTYIGTGITGPMLMGDSGDGSGYGSCGAAASSYTYYVGAPNSWGYVDPTYPNGSSNGHLLEVDSNALRVGQYACGNIYVKRKSGRLYSNTYTGLCGVQAGYDIYIGGYDEVGSSWCDGHPGGPTGNANEPIKGRCRYHFIRH